MSGQSQPVDIDIVNPNAPCVRTPALDVLWFQVGGTICNLTCHHCFISCSPQNDKFAFMSLETCERYLEESARLGVKEYYFTGGEPFANPQMCDILEKTLLDFGPATVLTNATLLREKTLRRLRDMDQRSSHCLEIRVSLDGYNAAMNDPIRGEGTFDSAIEGVGQLVAHGFHPIMTITRTWEGKDDEVLAGFVETLKRVGYDKPRLKILPLLKIGAEVDRAGGYGEEARITHAMMAEYDQSQLLCSSARLATAQGVWVCPILLDSESARMGDSLAESLEDYPLRHAACHTCWQFGSICSNSSGTACSATDGQPAAAASRPVSRYPTDDIP